jgi:hypothetical protein
MLPTRNGGRKQLPFHTTETRSVICYLDKCSEILRFVFNSWHLQDSSSTTPPVISICKCFGRVNIQTKQSKNCVAFSPQANYTD